MPCRECIQPTLTCDLNPPLLQDNSAYAYCCKHILVSNWQHVLLLNVKIFLIYSPANTLSIHKHVLQLSLQPDCDSDWGIFMNWVYSKCRTTNMNTSRSWENYHHKSLKWTSAIPCEGKLNKRLQSWIEFFSSEFY